MTDKIKEMIKNSVCFGVAFDPNAIECRGCDVHIACEKHQLDRKNNINTSIDDIVVEVTTPEDTAKSVTASTTKSASTSTIHTSKSASTSKSAKPKSTQSSPTGFSKLSIEEITDLFVKAGGNLAEYKARFTSPAILRMRMVMYLKKQ